MKAVAIETHTSFQRRHEVTKIDYSSGRLEITSEALDGSEIVQLTFSEVAGFRVLDEGDLLEFWPACSGNDAWIFQIIEGGWFDQERLRTGFIRGGVKEIKEYLVSGQNDCVNVFAWAAPKIQCIKT